MSSSPILGIDLGTTHSLAAVFQDGHPTLIPNALGDVMTPSAIALADDGSLLVGLAARERLGQPHTVTAFKRWMGSQHRVQLGRHSLQPEELSALVLKSLKADAEAWLGQPVQRAVITVPAYFNDRQRQATKTAGELAGLKVERLLNEPTAAGLAHGLQERAELSTFLVFDLGGGTFDVSVLEYFEGVVEVRASAGDTQLGGEDFTRLLVDAFLQGCPTLAALPASQQAAIVQDQRLWHAAEQAKRALSDIQQKPPHTQMHWHWRDQPLSLTITQAQWQALCQPLLARLRQPLERALRDARIEPDELHSIVLVGGASRMPVVHDLVRQLFGREPLLHPNPDETVALGAALQAALVERDAALSEVVLTDVMPYTLGVIAADMVDGNMLDDRFSPIIERNTPVPVSRMNSYTTLQDGQTEVLLRVCQGESPRGSDNLPLGQLRVSVPARPAGQVSIDVRFTYDASGLLEVQAHVPATGHTVSELILRDAQTLTDAQIKATLHKLQGLKVHPRDQQENAWLLARAQRLYADFLGEQRQRIGQALMQFEALLQRQDEHEIRRHRPAFRAFLDDMENRGWRL
ncbi:MAG: molecular chaperone HscC [Pseudomonadota bacterium]|nr:molecular chaperone HscC [Pseudomonadota bacterium]